MGTVLENDNALAIVGMSLRFPGATTVSRYWENLSSAVESIRRFSRQELLSAGIASTVIDDPRYVPAFGFVDGYADFDYTFFKMTKTEAEYADIQSRQFLQCAYHALEDACIDSDRHDGSIGVFAGSGPSMYLMENLLVLNDTLPPTEMLQILFANEKEYLTTNVAYRLNLTGPALSVQSACSTSLVAVHYACQSLLNGECDAAIAGGSSFAVPAETGYMAYEGMILSPQGHCRPFDAQADGTVPGSGCAAIVLKRLQDALENRDHVYGVICGSAVNNDGSEKAGFTAPGISGQIAVIREALAVAEIDPARIGFLEAHGTGTRLGDPVEFAALHQTYGIGRAKQNRLRVGSVKSNVGHLNAAAGIAGLIKAMLALYHKRIPPTLHFRTPNPALNIDETQFHINASCEPWDSKDCRFAAVSSFGVGGTNAHMILGEWNREEESNRKSERHCYLIPYSAVTEQSLNNLLHQHTSYLNEVKPAAADYAHSMAVGRKHRTLRTFVVGDAEGIHCQRCRPPIPKSAEVGHRAVLLLLPEAVATIGCCRELYETYESFRNEIDFCIGRLAAQEGNSVKELLLDPDASTKPDCVSQVVACFAFHRAIAVLLEDFGIKPELLGGTGVGEYAAASIAGVFSAEEGISLVSEYAAMQASFSQTRLLVCCGVQTDLETILSQTPPGIRTVLTSKDNRTGLSAVSGPSETVDAFAHRLDTLGVASLSFNIACPHREDTLKQRLAAALQGVAHRPSTRMMTGEQIAGTQYWVERLLSPLDFFQMVADDSRNSSSTTYVVCGHHTNSGSLIASLVAKHGTHDVSAIDGAHQGGAIGTVLETIGRLWQHGRRVNWGALNGSGKSISVPGYVFDKHRCWKGPPADTDRPAMQAASEIYKPAWREADPVEDTRRDGCALVFDTCNGTITRLLVSAGYKTVTIVYSEETSHTDWLVMDPCDEKGFVKLIEQHRETVSGCELMVYAWSMGKGDIQRHFFHPARLVEALSSTGIHVSHMLMLTTGVCNVLGNDFTQPLSALIRGVLNAVSWEYPDLDWRLLDVFSESEIDVGTLEAALATGNRRTTLALRGKKLWQRYYQAVAHKAGASLVRSGDTILITGGLGNTGLLLARYLLKENVATLVLTGRRPFPQRHEWDSCKGDSRQLGLISRLKELEDKFESRIQTFSIAVEDKGAMQRMVDEIEWEHGAIDGVVHAAGLVGADVMKPLCHVGTDDIVRHLTPKLDGIQILDTLHFRNPPRFFVLVSSLSAEIGGFGFGAYGAANASLDIAGERLQNPSHVVTVNFNGFPSESNTDLVDGNRMNSDEVDTILDRVFSVRAPQHLLVSRGMPRFRGKPKRKLIRAEPQTHGTGNTHTSVQTFVLQCIAELLGCETVGLDDDFFALGGDSLAAAQLNARIVDRFGVELPIADILSYPTPRIVCSAITESLHTEQTGVAPPKELLAQLESMSEEEAAELLRRLSDEENE